jgi:type III restriction enzyme
LRWPQKRRKSAWIAYQVIRKLENQPQMLPSVSYLTNTDVQALVLNEVAAQYRPSQLEIEGVTAKPDIAAIVAKTAELVIQQTIDIPRITVLPIGRESGFNTFTLKVDTLNYPPVSEELWAKHLRTDQVDVIAMGRGGVEESRLEDYVVSGLVDFDDVSYDSHADLLYDLAGQVVRHLRSYLLIPHDVIAENMTLEWLASQFAMN